MIPGVETYHPRSVWEPWCLPYTVASLDPPAQNPAAITQPVGHYTGADNLIDGDPGEHIGDMPAFIASIQRNYALSRGYSVGYLFAVDYLGGVWELRGFDYKSAANKGHNEYTCPILFLVDGADAVTSFAAASARAIWREFRRRANRADFKNRPLGHGELYLTTGIGTVTPCPGAGILAQLHDGYLDLDYDAPKETDMKTYPADRVTDTRGPQGPNYDAFKVEAGTSHQVWLPDVEEVGAAQVTFTAIDAERRGFLTVWAVGDRPETSFLNIAPAQPPTPETLFVPVATDGSFWFYSSARTHLLIDFTGICLT